MKHYLWAFLVFISCAAASLGFYYTLQSTLDDKFKEAVEIRSLEVKREFAGHFQERTESLHRMVDRWVFSGGTPKKNWLEDARQYVAHDQGFQAVEWADENFQVKWVIPEKGNEEALDLDLCFEAKRCEVLKLARETGEMKVTEPVKLVQGGTGILVLFPLFIQSQFNGFLMSVLKTDYLIEEALTTAYFNSKLEAHIVDRTTQKPVFKSGQFDDERKTHFSFKTYFELGNRIWDAEFQPSQQFLATRDFFLPSSFLAFGILLSFMVSLTVFISLKLRSQSRDLELASLKVSDSKNELESAVETYSLAIQGSSVGIWDWVDINSEKVNLTPKTFELLGYQDQEIEITATSIKKMFHQDDLDKTIELLKSHFRGEAPFDIEIRLKVKDGEYKWFRGFGQVARDHLGNPLRMVGSIQDIHEKKIAEEKLGYALSAKSDFLSLMSHEIRTPLNTVIGMSELLYQSLKKSENDKVHDYVERLTRTSQHLKKLIDNVLNIFQHESKTIQMVQKPFCLFELVENIIDMLSPQASQKNISFSGHLSSVPKLTLLGDSEQISQILINLVGNAIKFTDSGEVSLRVSAHEQGENSNRTLVKFEVHDTGIGISFSDSEKIFKEFSHIEQLPTGRREGTGLGLSIAKRLCESMKGRIWVKSELGTGSTFSFELPLIQVEESHSTTEIVTASKGQNGPLKLLVVDDNEDNRFVIQEYLNGPQYEVVTASNGKEAVSKFKQKKFNCVLMDLQMPELDGFEATSKIREYEKVNKRVLTQIIAMSAHAFTEEIDRALESGCNIYLTKPVNNQKLKDVLNKLSVE